MPAPNWRLPGTSIRRRMTPYLRGLYFIQRREADLAASYFRQAIALDPKYAAAHAGLAEALVTAMLVGGSDAAAIAPSASEAARHAIEFDPSSGEAYSALGAIDATYLWDWKAAQQNLRKGIELSPQQCRRGNLVRGLSDVGGPSGRGRGKRCGAPWCSTRFRSGRIGFSVPRSIIPGATTNLWTHSNALRNSRPTRLALW